MYTSAMRAADGLEIFANGLYPELAEYGTDDETKIFTGNRADKKHPAYLLTCAVLLVVLAVAVAVGRFPFLAPLNHRFRRCIG